MLESLLFSGVNCYSSSVLFRCREFSRKYLSPQTVFTTTIRLRFDCKSTALRPFDDLRYDRVGLSVLGCYTEA